MNFLRNVRENWTPELRESAFLERGVLTPAEFVAAGDQLVYRCPTWQWASGDPSRLRPYLPADKQFLVTRRVPCRSRVASLSRAEAVVEEEVAGAEGEDNWLAATMAHQAEGHQAEGGTSNEPATGQRSGPLSDPLGGAPGGAAGAAAEDEVEDISAAMSAATIMPLPPPPQQPAAADGAAGGAAGAAAEDEEDYEDLGAYEEAWLETGDAATLDTSAAARAQEPSSGAPASAVASSAVVRTRTYDLSLTYDKYYQTPRVWLFGYSEANKPLTEEQVFEDVMQDYAKRTVTMDPHPHLGTLHASVHPCKHAVTMKRIVDALGSGGREPRTAQYMFIFLKFIGSVVPTIEYDFTMATQAKASSS